jgi:chaperonin GroES
MNLKPVGNKLLIRMENEERKGKIIIPDHLIEKATIAEVVAVGDAVDMVKVGDRVMFDRYAVSSPIDGYDELFMVTDVDLLAIVE